MSFWSTLAGLSGPIVGAVVGGPIGAAIGTGVSALGSGLAQDDSNRNYLQGVNDTNASNYAIAQQNNQEAWRRLLQQNQFNVDMWNKQNAYNSPAAMMARLRQAGLNPAAFTGESPAAQVTSAAAPGMSTPTMQAPGQTPVVDYGRLYYERLAANEMVKKAQIENSDSSLRLSFLAQEKKQDLLEQAARISNMKSKTVESNWAVRKAVQDYEHFASIAKSLERGAALQVDSLEQNMKIQREENQRAWNQDSRDRARLGLDTLLAESNVSVNKAQRSHLYNMIDMAQQLNKRQWESHETDEILKHLDENLKDLHLNEQEKQNAFNEIMRASELSHTDLKDASLLNKFMERAFGLGLRDVGTALRNLTTIGK